MEDRVKALVQLGTRGNAELKADRLRHDAADGHPRVERRIGVLKDHVHVLAKRPDLALRQPGNVRPLEDDLSRGRLVEAHHRSPDRGFSASRLSNQRNDLARVDIE